MAEKEKNYFELLNDVDASSKLEQKGNLNYLSWVYAWAELKKRYPDANYTVYEHETNAGNSRRMNNTYRNLRFFISVSSFPRPFSFSLRRP